MTLGDAVDALRRPEHTGEDRCVPCTAANAAIAVLLAVGATALVGARLGWTVGGAAGLAVLAVAAAAIWLRGYLVPGTPRLTQTYFPDRLLARFDKLPDEPDGRGATGTAGTAAGEPAGLDVEAALQRAGAVAPCKDADDLCLTDGFREEWRRGVAAVEEDGDPREALAALLDVAAGDLAIEEHGEALVARLGDVRAGQWESRAALVADLAAASALADRLDGWDDLGVAERGRLLYGLRIFIEECPACGGPVAFAQETVASCCRSREVVAVACRECGARLFESALAGDAGAAPA